MSTADIAMKRGLTQQEAMAYVGVKRRTWESLWAPRLVGMQQGVCLIFDRNDLDRVFDEFKHAAQGLPADAANDSQPPPAQNAHRNGRPTQKGRNTWAKTHGASTPTKKEPGKLTSGTGAHAYASAALAARQRLKAG